MTRQLRPVPDAPRRAVALIRVSKVGERGDDLTSPEIQRMKIAEYAAQRGYAVVDWVEALDESASRSSSPWWARLDAAVERVESGDIDVILVWRLSRAARHRRRWAVAIDRVDVAGGTLESATEQIDAKTSTGRLARGMLAELAAWEADVKSEMWRETHDRRRRAGLAHTNQPRFGYTRDGDRYAIDAEVAPLIVQAYRRYVAGDGARAVADWLNSTGVRQPRSGGLWSPKTTLAMLDSGWAAGQLRVGDSYIEGAHPAIIDGRLWRAFLRERGRRGGQPARLVSPAHPLSGLVRCPGCGRAMRLKRTARRWAHGRKTDRPGTPMFACETFGCPAPLAVSAPRALREVLAWLRPLVDDVDVSDAVRVADQAARTVARADRRRLIREVARVEQALTRLTVDLASGLVLPGDYAAARDELVATRDRANAALAATEDVTDRPAPGRTVRRLLDAWDEMDIVGRRRALADVIARVDVVPPTAERRALIRPLGVWEVPTPSR